MHNTNAPLGRVQLKNLCKKFGHTTKALDEFNCEFDPGELVVLLGPSGCGKTTALRALTGLERVDSGQILLDNTDITKLTPAKRNMAMVFQQYSLFPHLTALQNVEFGLKVRKIEKQARKKQAAEALEMVGLSDQANKYTSQMSGGQQQRVALARALVVKPRVLALDEPLSALDAKVRVNLREEIRRIQQESGITTLFVTHDQEEALAIADRVGVMHEGKIAQIDTPQNIYDSPNSEFVASFIGITNRLPGTIIGDTVNVYGQRVPLIQSAKKLSGQVTILVRPESILLHTVDPQESHTGDIAIIVSLSFLGSQARVELKLSDGRSIISQINPSKAALLTRGDYVRIEVVPKPVLAVKNNMND